MNKKMKQNLGAAPSAGYASPTVRLINFRTRCSILTTSNDIYNTDPTETGRDQNVF